jgi:hypothetical protein
MPHLAIEKCLSISRLSTYRNAVKGILGEECIETAIELYEWNAQLSSQLLVPLHIYEITLRNAVSEAISLRYGSNWPTNTAFQTSLPYKQRQDLTNLLSDYQSPNKILPELKLFWFENMLKSSQNSRIWTQHIQTVFPNATGVSPDGIRQKLKEDCFIIRKIRNRIAHHEPIFNHPYLPNISHKIENTISNRCVDTRNWLQGIEGVKKLLGNPVV